MRRLDEWARWAEIGTFLVAFLTLLVAVYAYYVAVNAYYSDEEGREEQRYNSAWVVVNSPGQPSIDGGRREALQYLMASRRSLQGADLSNALLSYIDLNGADLNRSNMRNTDLFGADLRAASLWGGHMEDAIFQFAQLQGVDLEYAHLECADLRGAHLNRLNVKRYLDSISLDNANIEDIEGRVQNGYVTGPIRKGEIHPFIPINLERANLEFAHLEGANLSYARLAGAHLKHAHLERYKDKFESDEYAKYDANLRRPGDNNYINSTQDKPPDRHVHCVNRSTGLEGLYRDKPENWEPLISDICGWFSGHKPLPVGKPKDQTTASFCLQAAITNLTDAVTNLTDAVTNLTDAVTNLTDAYLKRADLRVAILTDAHLTGADLTDAVTNLTDAHLTAADLTDAVTNLTDAHLTGADLRWAILTDAHLTRADLTDACLKRADLRWADLTDAHLTRADLTEADLRGAILDADQIDDTVHLCETKLPDHITEKISGSRNCSDPAPQHCSKPTSSTQGYD